MKRAEIVELADMVRKRERIAALLDALAARTEAGLVLTFECGRADKRLDKQAIITEQAWETQAIAQAIGQVLNARLGEIDTTLTDRGVTE